MKPTATVSERLEALERRIHALAEEAFKLVHEDMGEKATTVHWNITAGLAEAKRACRSAIRIEQGAVNV